MAAITVIIVFLVFAVYWGLFRPNNNSGPVDTSSNVELASRSKADSIARFQHCFAANTLNLIQMNLLLNILFPDVARCLLELHLTATLRMSGMSRRRTER